MRCKYTHSVLLWRPRWPDPYRERPAAPAEPITRAYAPVRSPGRIRATGTAICGAVLASFIRRLANPKFHSEWAGSVSAREPESHINCISSRLIDRIQLSDGPSTWNRSYRRLTIARSQTVPSTLGSQYTNYLSVRSPNLLDRVDFYAQLPRNRSFGSDQFNITLTLKLEELTYTLE